MSSQQPGTREEKEEGMMEGFGVKPDYIQEQDSNSSITVIFNTKNEPVSRCDILM